MLEQLASESRGRGLVVLGVDVDTRAIDRQSPASMDDLAGYGRKFAITYPLLFDPRREQAGRYIVSGYPTMYAIDRAGTIAWAANGEVSVDVLRGVTNQLLNG